MTCNYFLAPTHLALPQAPLQRNPTTDLIEINLIVWVLKKEKRKKFIQEVEHQAWDSDEMSLNKVEHVKTQYHFVTKLGLIRINALL